MTHESSSPPPPAALSHLKPSDATGARFVGLAAALTGGGLWLAGQSQWPLWLAGQLSLGLAFVQWFALLHECGHGTLFRSRRLHVIVGHAAGFFALIPFEVWKRIHQRHHKWTGWQDVDPTTAALIPRSLRPWERRVINLCWRYWIPLFAVLYRLNNFWNLPRLRKVLEDADVRDRAVASIAALATAYVALILWVGPLLLLRVAGLGMLLALVIEDVILISQHTHMPMGLSHGHLVYPYPAIAQESFTRSLRLPGWWSRLLLHFDAHELHHMYPFVPGYRLDEVPYVAENEVSWREWVPAARAVPGERLLFQNRDESGLDL